MHEQIYVHLLSKKSFTGKEMGIISYFTYVWGRLDWLY